MKIINEKLKIEYRDEEKLFQKRKLVGDNVLEIIRDRGYTKSSFSKIVDISRPTLDKIIKGDVDNKTTFISHIEKIINSKIVMVEELLNYQSAKMNIKLGTFYSDNAPSEYRRDNKVNELFMILDDLINLSEVYQDK